MAHSGAIEEKSDTRSSPSQAREEVHKPSEHSLWPFVVAVGILLIAVGILHQMAIAVIGILVVLAAVVGWMWQPWVS